MTKHTVQRKATPPRASTTAWQSTFIMQMRVNGVVTSACKIAGIERSTAYRQRDTDASFAALWDEAIEIAADNLEEEAYRRAHDGTSKGVWYKGKHVGSESEYSDTLMVTLLKANRPDKFGDKLTIKLAPEHAALLKANGMTAAQAWQLLMDELASAEVQK